MKIREMLDRVREWLQGSRRRQISAAGIGLVVIALAVSLPVYVAAFSGSDDRAEDVQLIPTPSPTATLPPPTPEPTPTAQPEFTIPPGTLTAGAIVFTGEAAADPPGVFLADSDGVRRIGDNLHRGHLDLKRDADGLTLIGDRLYSGPYHVAWTSDATKAVFVVCPERPILPAELYVVNTDGTGLTSVSNDPGHDVVKCQTDAPFGGIHWSPDGSRLVFWSGRDPQGLYVVNADGSGLRYLTEGMLPTWSPTGTSIAFVRSFFPEGESVWEVPIYAIDPDGSNERLVARVPRDCSRWALDGRCSAPRGLYWSPDGSTLAFTAVPEPPDFSQLEAGEEPNHEVFVINADGTGLTNITDNPGEDYFANWVNCDLPLPTAGCELKVTNVQPQRLNLREDPGTDQEVTGKLSEGETVCLLGSPGLADGFQWWPLRTADSQEGWAAASDPGEVNKPWLTATGRTCQGEQVEPVADASGAAPSGGSPLPDFARAVAGDDGSGPLPLGSVTTLPESVQLDFLFEFCWGPCFRDGHYMDPNNPGVGSGPFTSDTPFHVRHGFINNGDEPLGEGFDVVIYVTELDQPGESGGQGIGETYRYTSDYVIRGTSEACGPTYRTQTGPETCEWFVHEFNDGLPGGRHALWAVWEAPCSAWVDYGFTDSCADPNEVISLFSSGFDSPFGPFPPDFSESSDAP